MEVRRAFIAFCFFFVGPLVVLPNWDRALDFMKVNPASGYLIAALVTATAITLASMRNANAVIEASQRNAEVAREAASASAKNIERQIEHAAEMARQDRAAASYQQAYRSLRNELGLLQAINVEVATVHDLYDKRIQASFFKENAKRYANATIGRRLNVFQIDGYDQIITSNLGRLDQVQPNILTAVLEYHAMFIAMQRLLRLVAEQHRSERPRQIIVNNLNALHIRGTKLLKSAEAVNNAIQLRLPLLTEMVDIMHASLLDSSSELLTISEVAARAQLKVNGEASASETPPNLTEVPG